MATLGTKETTGVHHDEQFPIIFYNIPFLFGAVSAHKFIFSSLKRDCSVIRTATTTTAATTTATPPAQMSAISDSESDGSDDLPYTLVVPFDMNNGTTTHEYKYWLNKTSASGYLHNCTPF